MKKNINNYLFFIEAWLFLSFAKLIILLIPFKQIAARIGIPQHETDFDSELNEIVIDIQNAVIRGVKYVFFTSKCYDQALATTFMLKRRGVCSTLYFGLNKDGDQLSAHAWVRCGHYIVSGRGGYEKFIPVAWFGSHSKTKVQQLLRKFNYECLLWCF